jgi:TRAP-type mannitol/chloroaromatic compound transport system permease small subunit
MKQDHAFLRKLLMRPPPFPSNRHPNCALVLFTFKRLGAYQTQRMDSGSGKTMQGLLGLSRGIDTFNEKVGRALAWLILVAVIVSTVNAIIRKVFNVSSNAWLEAQWYLFGAVFLGCAAYTFLKNEHIRIDIVSSKMSQRYRNTVEIIGHTLFLMPLCIMMIYFGFPFFYKSFIIGETSSNAGGLTQWPAKLMIPLGFSMLFAQAISELIKRIAIIQGLIPDPHAAKTGPH